MSSLGPSNTTPAPDPCLLEDPSTYNIQVEESLEVFEGSYSNSIAKSAKTWAFIAPRASYLIPYSDNSTAHDIMRSTRSGLESIFAMG